jgi:hypothetical protein
MVAVRSPSMICADRKEKQSEGMMLSNDVEDGVSSPPQQPEVATCKEQPT